MERWTRRFAGSAPVRYQRNSVDTAKEWRLFQDWNNRHAFAVHRLIAWYRAGANVQAMLPPLSTYLGHLNVSGTQTYLTMTPELLAEASLRFEGYASMTKEDTHE